MASIPDDYYSIAADLESSNDPTAHNTTTGASGLYQFLPSTWKGMGLSMGDIMDPKAQQSAMAQLTASNAASLSNHGIPVTDASLYSAHVLGASGAAKVFGADPETSLSSLIGKAATKANPFLGSTAGSAVAALTKKVSAAGNGFASLGNSLAGEAESAMSSVGGGIASAFNTVTHPVSSVIQQIQAWFINSAFFTRMALGVVAVIILIAGFALLKPVQGAVASGAKLAA